MKILTKLMLPLAMAILVLSACTKEQTSLSVEDIKGKATITGCIAYTTGQSYENGTFIEKFSPAAKALVQIKISNSDLAPNGNATGYTIYETATDQNGNYSVEIPALDNGVSVIVKAPSFTGKRTYVAGFDGNNVVIEEEDVIYEANEASYSNLVPGDIKICDIMYGYRARGTVETFDEVEVLYGRVGISQYYYKSYNDFERNSNGQISWTTDYGETVYGGYEVDDYYYNNYIGYGYRPIKKTRHHSYPYWGAKSNINVLVTVTYPAGYTEVVQGSEIVMTRTFGATTDKDGKFEIKVPVREKGITLSNVKIEPIAYRETKFKNYYQEFYSSYYDDFNMSETLDGIYQKASYSGNGNYGSYTFSKFEDIITTLDVKMLFYPRTDIEQNHHYASYDFSNCDDWGTDSF